MNHCVFGENAHTLVDGTLKEVRAARLWHMVLIVACVALVLCFNEPPVCSCWLNRNRARA